LQPARFALLLFLFLASACVIQAQSEPNGLQIPGGVRAFYKAAGLKASPDNSAQASALFRRIVDESQMRNKLLAYIEGYSRLIKFFQNGRMINPGEKELWLPLSGNPSELEITKKTLSFLGMRYRAIESKIVLDERPIKATSNRSELLHALGFSNLDSDSAGIRIPLSTESIPLVLDEQTWSRIFPQKGGSGLLIERFLRNPQAIQLYLAIAACSQNSGKILTGVVAPNQLLESSAVLSSFGRELKFIQGELAFPGSASAWKRLLNAENSNEAIKALLTQDRGAPLLLYNSLATAPKPIQERITSSAETLRSYYEIIRSYASPSFPDSSAIAAGQELSRILQLSIVDSFGLHLALSARASTAFFRSVLSDKYQSSATRINFLNPPVLKQILPKPGISGYAQRSMANAIDFLHHLELTRLQSLSEESLSELTLDFDQSPIFLDLIGDIAPEPALLSEYLRYCRKLAANGMSGWNVNKTRTSQSIFFTLAALLREGAISNQQANSLLAKALRAFDKELQSDFAQSTAQFLSESLLPELSSLSRDAADPILTALSGLKINSAAANLKYGSMQKNIESQACTNLQVMLRAYHLIAEIQSQEGSSSKKAELDFLEQLNQFRAPEWTPATGKESRAKTAAPIKALKAQFESLQKAGDNNELQTRARKLSEQMHSELSLALLSYCYAYAGDSQIDVFGFDPNLVRKHRFYDPDAEKKWMRCRFAQSALDSFMQGSLAGLGYELCRLQIAQSNKRTAMGSDLETAIAALYAFRQLKPGLQTDRSQAYVALAAKLGRKVLLESRQNSATRQWATGFLTSLISPRRIEELNGCIEKENACDGVSLLSPSEFFLLGHQYFNSFPGSKDDPATTALRKLVPQFGTQDFNDFSREVNQYGPSLIGRAGLSQFSLNMINSYEFFAGNLKPQLLYDRICDLKIRMAELNYDLGLPAFVMNLEAELAVQGFLSKMPSTDEKVWKRAIRSINELNRDDALQWFHRLLNRGILTHSPEKQEAFYVPGERK
jgi:hypothetical protein